MRQVVDGDGKAAEDVPFSLDSFPHLHGTIGRRCIALRDGVLVHFSRNEKPYNGVDPCRRG